MAALRTTTRAALMMSAIATAVIAITSCEFDTQALAVTTPQVVVHAVLDPSATVQEVLLEKTLTGAVVVNEDQRFDVLDPVNTAGGIPIIGALVTITGPDGVLTGREVHYTGKATTYGAGRYEIAAGAPVQGVSRPPIRPGATYSLVIRTLDGGFVTGKTTVPAGVVATTTIAGTLNRESDSLRLSWKASVGARTYGLRVETPFGAFQIFSDTTHLTLPGLMRNLFASDFKRTFIPGFLQVSTVFAVDTNFFDYFRSRNDPFTGSGIINTVDGGIGLFGSILVLETRSTDVTQPLHDTKLEGTYDIVTGPVSSGIKPFVDVFKLWIETPGTASASLSGNYQKDRTLAARDGMAGARDGTRIELQFLSNQDIHSTYIRFIGTQVADSLIGTYSSIPGRVVFKKRP